VTYYHDDTFIASSPYQIIGIKDKQPGTIRLLIKKLSAKVTVSPKAVTVELILTVNGAGERT